jgi:hypothetical protein
MKQASDFLKTKNPDEKFIRIVIDVGNEGFEPPTLLLVKQPLLGK